MLAVFACAAALVGPPTVQSADAWIDDALARDGIVVRIGAAADDWRVSVGPATEARVVVTMTAPDGTVLQREVTLDAPEPDARARQLAAAVAVVIDAHEPREAPTAQTQEEPMVERSRVGWIAAGASVSSGPAARASVAPGATVAGGASILGDHMQPTVEVGWRRSWDGALTVDGVRVGGGAQAGGAVGRGHVWLGAGAVVGALGGFARASKRASGWAASVTLPVTAQARLARLLLELHVGPELTLPPLRFVGDADAVRWGHLRVLAGLRVGLSLGGTARFGFRPRRSV